MYKTVVLLLTVLLLLFSGCEARTNSNPPSESSISEVPVESEAGSQESGSSDGDKNSEEESSEQSESPYIYHEYTKKYYDYFMENNYVIMLLGDETGDRGFSDSEMSFASLLS